MDDRCAASGDLAPPTLCGKILGTDQASLRQQHWHQCDHAGVDMEHRHRVEEAIPPGLDREATAALREGEEPFSRREPVVVRFPTAHLPPGPAGGVENA